MFLLRVEAEFAAAHFLSHYHGKCENLHGHNYRVRLWIEGSLLNEGGMIADFSVLKKTLREVTGLLDHKNLNDMEIFKNDPSAERIAKFIHDEVKARFILQDEKIRPHAVDVFETRTSMARYKEK